MSGNGTTPTPNVEGLAPTARESNQTCTTPTMEGQPCGQPPFPDDQDGNCIFHTKCDKDTDIFKAKFIRHIERSNQLAVDCNNFIFPEISLQGIQFTKIISFQGARFLGRTNFGGVVFGANAIFRGTKFGATVDFMHASFLATADFEGALFGEYVSFQNAKFNSAADFHRASFGAAAPRPMLKQRRRMSGLRIMSRRDL